MLCPGLIGAGTNNARLAGLLRGLSSYYYKEPTLLFLVRVAQGLVHMGKGLLTMSPTHTDNQLVSGPGPPKYARPQSMTDLRLNGIIERLIWMSALIISTVIVASPASLSRKCRHQL